MMLTLVNLAQRIRWSHIPVLASRFSIGGIENPEEVEKVKSRKGSQSEL